MSERTPTPEEAADAIHRDWCSRCRSVDDQLVCPDYLRWVDALRQQRQVSEAALAEAERRGEARVRKALKSLVVYCSTSGLSELELWALTGEGERPKEGG